VKLDPGLDLVWVGGAIGEREESGTEVGFGEIEEVSILSLPGTGCEVGRAGCDGPSLGVWTDACTDGGAAAELVL
jgi:hypothetical protein